MGRCNMMEVLRPSEYVYWKVVGMDRKREEKAAWVGLLIVNGELKWQ